MGKEIKSNRVKPKTTLKKARGIALKPLITPKNKVKIAENIYYLILHSEKPLTAKQIATALKYPLQKVSNKLFDLKRQGFVNKDNNQKWITALK